MPEHVSIRPADLLLDTQNPRLPAVLDDQREIIRSLFRKVGEKQMLALAKDIANQGMLDPTQNPIAMEAEDGGYVVLEGNRRLCVLRGLENPDTLKDLVAPSTLKGFKDLGKKYHKDPIKGITCWVVKDRKEAAHWLNMRHRGQMEGAGVRPWDAAEGRRFDARNGKSLPYEMQFLQYFIDEGLLPQARVDQGDVPVTTLERLLGTGEIQARLGISKERGQLRINGDVQNFRTRGMRILDDLISKEKTVSDLKNQKQREAYARTLPGKAASNPGLPKTEKKEGKSPTAGSGKASSKTAAKPPSKPRTTMIPTGLKLNVTQERIAHILQELQSLPLNKYPNAISVLSRVFVELSTDEYLTIHGITASEKATLAAKLVKTTEHLEKAGKLNQTQAKALSKTWTNQFFLGASVHNMHGYVHNQYIFPAPEDLRHYWSQIESFVLAIWKS